MTPHSGKNTTDYQKAETHKFVSSGLLIVCSDCPKLFESIGVTFSCSAGHRNPSYSFVLGKP